MTLATVLIACSGLFAKPLYEHVENGDAAALLDQAEAAVQNVRSTLESEGRAIQQARAGLACLNGTGRCPGGERSPFGP